MIFCKFEEMNFMKKLIAILTFLSLISCGNTFPEKRSFDKINSIEIENIQIKKNLNDSIVVDFSKNDIENFVNEINSSKKLELRKAIPNYWIFVKFKNGDERKFKLTETYIGENDWYMKTRKTNLFQNIYIENQKSK